MKRRRIVAVPVALVVLGAVAWLAFRPAAPDERGLAASGTVEATYADLGFQTAGRITEVAVREGDRVEAGAVLARLDDTEIRARAAHAEAQLAAARALLAELERGARPEELRQAEAAAEAAARRLDEAARALERIRHLHDGGAVSREALEQSETAHAVARAQYDQAREQLELVRRGPRPERIDAQRAAVRQAEAAVEQVAAALAYTEIRAPFAGLVTIRHREPGETVAPGVPVVTLMDTGDRWGRIYVREDRIGRVRIGQPARIRSDTFRDREYDGRVVHIAGEAEFTPRNVQTEEERTKLVYAVKVAITGDPDFDLKPGIPADVRLVVEGDGDG